MITGGLAQSTVTDLDTAREWYDRVLGHSPDSFPMPGLIEYHLADGFGLQVWSEPDRAGRCSVVLSESDLDALAERLRAAGIPEAAAREITSGRVVQLEDPDGNRVVFVGQ